MAERSAAVLRSRRATGPTFPHAPTLPPGAACDGVTIVGGVADLVPLRALRDDIAAIRHGMLAGQALLVVTFVAPRRVDPALLPAALPLARRGDTLGSYVAERHVGPVPPAPHAAPQRLDLWWGGQAHGIALDTLQSVPLAALWDMPQVIVHRAIVGASDVAERQTARVSHAELRIAAGSIAAFDETEARLQALHDRTRLGAIARQAWDTLFGARSIGDDGGTAGGMNEAVPGVFENLAGWVRWHTPLGKGLSAAFGERMRTVEKLLQSGDVDGALKLALKLGRPGEKGGRSRFPARLPGIRSSLDFTIGGGFSMPILGGGSFDTLHQRYTALAATLEGQGDHRRAAYIRAQLLGEHLLAVLTLERGGLFGDAAKLALDAKLDPTVYIRLFYKAGERDTALALARRTGCFEALAEDSRGHDAGYHAAVVKAWTDLLLATDQPLRALQVTDALAAYDAVLVERRRDWLGHALDLAGPDGPGSELLVRTWLTARWDADDLAPAGWTDFPGITGGVAPFADARDRAQALVRGDDGDALLALLGDMTRLGDARLAEQAAFWRGPAGIVVDVLARAVLEHASGALAPRDLDTLAALLRRARQEVFATDLSKLRKLHCAPAAPREDWHLPPPAARSAVVRRACLLHDGRAVAWRETGQMYLLDPRGAPLWQGQVSDVTALVAVGSGPNVLVVQRVPGADDDLSRLTRFATHQRRFHDIGTVRLAAHHDVTSEGQWLVQIGGEIGALDIAALCADTPRIEFLWSCRLTEQVRAIGFLHEARGHAWITRSLHPGRAGLLELFVLTHTQDLHARIARPAASGERDRPIRPNDWFWRPEHGHDRLERPTSTGDTLPFVAWSAEAERAALRLTTARRDLYPAPDTIQSGDFGRRRVGPAGDDSAGRTIVAAAVSIKAPRLTLHHAADEALTCVARAPQTAGGGVLLADPHGRLLHVDVARRAVAIW